MIKPLGTARDRADYVHAMLCEIRELYPDEDGENLRYLIGMAALEAHRLCTTPIPAGNKAIDVQRLYMADSLESELG